MTGRLSWDDLELAVEACRDQLTVWRRRFHQDPELELDCHQTAAVVAGHLASLGLEVKTGIAQSGVVGLIHGSGAGPTAALRLDMDALPISEQTGLDFSSQVAGVMHACGHDAHTAIGLGVATVLTALRHFWPGAVKLIFQPGEEYPGAAKTMIAEGVLKEPQVEAIFGCHLYPEMPTGQVGIRYGVMTAANDEFNIRLKGPGGHGSSPHQCPDPIVAAGHLIVGLQTIVSRFHNPLEPLVISIGEIKGGGGHNVIATEVSLKGTIRSVSQPAREAGRLGLERMIKGLETAWGLNIELNLRPGEPSLVNDEGLVAFVEESLGELLGPDSVRRLPSPSLGAEDFAYLAELVPAVYLRLGCQEEKRKRVQALHSPFFDFDEAVLATGTRILAFLLMRFLSSRARAD